ncbi:histidine phosphatase family protein [Burkholderiaceae bacterium FT117]|uniref:histidine phosphatase family protein n=1 Tax=Zeimonas sediminis TaxID=2944268 RepID=UPI002342CE5B|nr:histidine phosphatase family protein [Zeimonas sediminis]MCM5569850.1 histidine phosphatase family protein [Zeimonas sediminis]
MALVYFVRHAQASFGSHDYDRLSELGRRQARWLGEWFAEHDIRFRRVLAGTLLRQQDTAREILAATGGDPGAILTHPGLDEYRAEAIWSAHTGGQDPIAHQRADYKGYWRTFREAMEAWADDRLTGVPETWGEFGARVREALDEAARDATREDALLVVSSGGAIGRAIAGIVGSPSKVAIEFNLQFRNTGFCELIAGGGGMRMLSFNAIPHLMRPERREAITFA